MTSNNDMSKLTHRSQTQDGSLCLSGPSLSMEELDEVSMFCKLIKLIVCLLIISVSSYTCPRLHSFGGSPCSIKMDEVSMLEDCFGITMS